MTTRIATSSLLLGIAMLLLPCSMASAKLTGACLSDAKALCAGVQPGGGKVRDCLKSHVKDPVRRLPSSGAQGRECQSLCG